MAIWASEMEKADHFDKVCGCSCPPYCPSLWDADPDCPVHGAEIQAEMEAEAKAEIWAENAWLRAAEAPTNDDYAFEQYEARLGLI